MSDEHHTETGPEPSIATFIRKIYAILEDHLFPEAIDWNTDGTALVIKKPSDFSQKVLPRYFKHNHISSFIRQLNMYGFQKKRSRHAGHVYMHELFLRGQKHLLSKIKRKVKDGLAGNNTQASPQESVAAASSEPSSSLMDENHLLKGMKEDAFDKVKSLEQKVKELAAQNEKLVQHLQQQKQKEHSMTLTFTKNNKQEVNSIYASPVKESKQPSASTSYNHREALNKTPVKLFVKQEEQSSPFETAPLKQIHKVSPARGFSFTISSNTFTLSEFGNKINEALSSSNKRSPQRQDNFEESYESSETASNKPSKKPSTYNFNYQGIKFEDNTPVPSLLEKRPFHLDEGKTLFCEDGLDESINKFLRCDSPVLNLRDVGKIQSGFFSNFGENEGRQRFDSDLDLLCFH